MEINREIVNFLKIILESIFLKLSSYYQKFPFIRNLRDDKQEQGYENEIQFKVFYKPLWESLKD